MENINDAVLNKRMFIQNKVPSEIIREEFLLVEYSEDSWQDEGIEFSSIENVELLVWQKKRIKEPFTYFVIVPGYVCSNRYRSYLGEIAVNCQPVPRDENKRKILTDIIMAAGFKGPVNFND
ncbi:MAG: hypothetical protein ABH824_02190 [Nanoarchaeota archaeon]|nr:hypothetical protein [Nanoarchaeota archaeon]MBU1875592.1 hypothetical protein [Nanoarchaeota archaeon]